MSCVRIFLCLILLLLIYPHRGGIADVEDAFKNKRMQMVTEIREMVRDTREYTGRSVLAEEVMAAMAKVPRHEFIPRKLHDYAYENRPLPIGAKQTISQPYIVALMTDLANINRDSVVLEVGTGSGYQAAILAEIARHVYSIEIIESLGTRAAETLKRLNYKNVTVRIGDGYHGWEEFAPFDAILVTAAPEHIPEPLIKQLRAGGTMVIPVGPQYQAQSLKILQKDQTGVVHTRDILPVGFVPLTGKH